MRSALSFAPGILAAALVAAGPAAEARAAPIKVAVVPFAPLTGRVPVHAGGKSATLLAGELGHVADLSPIELPIERDEAGAQALLEARAAVAAAQQLEASRRFGAAAGAYRQALAKFERAAAQLPDAAELSDVYVALGTALYLTGDDVGGEQELRQAISLTPKRQFQGESTSKLFTATVAAVREKVLAAPKASLQVSSVPAGAQVTLDGRALGRTPLTIRELPPGRHLWRVLLPTSEPAGGVLTLAAGERQSVSAALTGSSPVSRLNALLSTNRLDAAATGLAREVAAAAGAEAVVFGALLGRGEELVLESFLYSVSKDALVRLPSRTFDAELISAGMELFKVAGEVGARIQALGAEVKLPGKVSLEAPPVEAAERSEIAFQLPGEAEPQVEAPQGGRRPLDPLKPQRVLKPRGK